MPFGLFGRKKSKPQVARPRPYRLVEGGKGDTLLKAIERHYLIVGQGHPVPIQEETLLELVDTQAAKLGLVELLYGEYLDDPGNGIYYPGRRILERY